MIKRKSFGKFTLPSTLTLLTAYVHFKTVLDDFSSFDLMELEIRCIIGFLINAIKFRLSSLLQCSNKFLEKHAC